MTFAGDNLRRLREAYGETQNDLAACLDVTRQTVSNWGKKLRQIDDDIKTKIADHYHISLDTLINEPISEEYLAHQTELTRLTEAKYNALFPLSTSDEANKNKSFLRAYNLDKKCTKRKQCSETDLENICHNYRKALSDGIKEGAANIIRRYMIYNYEHLNSNNKLFHIWPNYDENEECKFPTGLKDCFNKLKDYNPDLYIFFLAVIQQMRLDPILNEKLSEFDSEQKPLEELAISDNRYAADYDDSIANIIFMSNSDDLDDIDDLDDSFDMDSFLE